MKKIHPKNIAQIDDIDELIDVAYVLFGSHRLCQPLQVCTYCCVMPHHVEQMYQYPVHELSKEVIFDYLDAAQSGTDEALSAQIRYFIPRIFELLVKGEYIRHDTELTFDKCRLDLGVWSKQETAVFERFCELYFIQKLVAADKEKFCWLDIFGMMVMVNLSGIADVQRWFGLLIKHLYVDNVLINLCAQLYYEFKDGWYQNPYAKPSLTQQIYDWLTQKSTCQITSRQLIALTQKPIYHRLDDEQRFWVDYVFDWMADVSD